MASSNLHDPSYRDGQPIEKPAAVYLLPNSPLDHEELMDMNPKPLKKTRSKLRLLVILVALYVSLSIQHPSLTLFRTHQHCLNSYPSSWLL